MSIIFMTATTTAGMIGGHITKLSGLSIKQEMMSAFVSYNEIFCRDGLGNFMLQNPSVNS
jgi:hypothetical protein